MYDYHALCQRIFGGIGVLVNAFSIYLIVFKSPKNLGNYKFLMIYISVFELIYALMDMMTAPEIFSKDSAFFVMIKSDKTILPESFIFSATVIFSSMFGISIAIFAIHFVYRYVTVTRPSFQSIFASWKFILWLFFPVIFGLIWSLIINLTLTSNESGDLFLEQEYLWKTYHTIDQVYYIGPYYYPRKFLSILVILFFEFKCYKHTTKVLPTSSQSSHFKNLQTQLFYALFFQTLIPVVLMHTPAFFIFIATFLDCSFELLGQIPSITIVLYPSIDPLPNIFIIKDYRIATLNYLKRILRWFLRGNVVEIGILESNCGVKFDLATTDNRSNIAATQISTK